MKIRKIGEVPQREAKNGEGKRGKLIEEVKSGSFKRILGDLGDDFWHIFCCVFEVLPPFEEAPSEFSVVKRSCSMRSRCRKNSTSRTVYPYIRMFPIKKNFVQPPAAFQSLPLLSQYPYKKLDFPIFHPSTLASR